MYKVLRYSLEGASHKRTTLPSLITKVSAVGKANRGVRLTEAIEETSTQPYQEGLAIGEAKDLVLRLSEYIPKRWSKISLTHFVDITLMNAQKSHFLFMPR